MTSSEYWNGPRCETCNHPKEFAEHNKNGFFYKHPFKTKEKKVIMYTAVVARVDANDKLVPESKAGPWSCYMGEDKDLTIKKALESCERSNARPYQFSGQYRVFVGEITHRAVPPVQYELVLLPVGK